MEHIPTTEEAVEELSFREATLPPNLRELRQKLGQKAKQQKRFRFYSLYALACRTDVLQAAWDAVRRNGDAPGVDGKSIEQIAATPESEAAFLSEIERSLKDKTYRAQAVRRVSIPKANGQLRSLGLPTVRDRVMQAAVLLRRRLRVLQSPEGIVNEGWPIPGFNGRVAMGTTAMIGFIELLLAVPILAMAVLGTIFWIWMLVDCATKEPDTGNNKLVWVVIIVLTHWIGAAIYFFVRRPQRKAETGR